MRSKISIAAIALCLLPTPAISADCYGSPKQVVEGFLQTLYVDKKPRQAFEAFVSKDYIEHSPWLDGDLEAIISFYELQASANPDEASRIKRMLADDDRIAVLRQARIRPDSPDSKAVMEIFRIEDCKIVEHWEVSQPVPLESPNHLNMF